MRRPYLQRMQPILYSLLILVSVVFSDCVVFYGDCFREADYTNASTAST